MRIIGITGIIGSGKSTIAGFLHELGAQVIDADEIGHQIYAAGTEGWKQLVAVFGDAIITKDGTIDRQKLGRIVFENKTARARLNDITHPMITRKVKALLSDMCRRKAAVAVIEAVMLIEAGWVPMVDELWITTAPRKVIYQRLKTRNGMARGAVLSRIRSQLPVSQQRKYATRIIDTNVNLAKLKARVSRIFNLSISQSS